MKETITCPGCGGEIHVNVELGTQRKVCFRCGARFTIRFEADEPDYAHLPEAEDEAEKQPGVPSRH